MLKSSGPVMYRAPFIGLWLQSTHYSINVTSEQDQESGMKGCSCQKPIN